MNLITLVKLNNFSLIQSEINKWIDINQRDEINFFFYFNYFFNFFFFINGYTSLHWASMNGFYDIVELLILNGSDLNIENNSIFH